MSEPSASEVLSLLADYMELKSRIDAHPAPFTEWEALRGQAVPITERIHALEPAHLRTLAAALTAPAPAEADAERDLRLWMTGLYGGASSEAIACACLRIEPRFGHFSPPHDSDDLGRCLRLIDAIPEAREGVRILAARDSRWARLEPIWDQLTEMGTAAGLLEKGGWHPEINVLVRAALNPEATP